MTVMLVTKRPAAWLITGILMLIVGCGSAAPPLKQPEPKAPSVPAAPPSADANAMLAAVPAPEPAPEPKPEPTDPVAFSQALAPLRPASAQSALSALEAAPADAQAYAKAALAYAETDVPVMTLVWGVTYQALGGGTSDVKVAAAVAKVLNERILVKRAPDSDEVTFTVRLAPGQMPVRVNADGSAHAPLAHTFEALFSTTLMGFRPPWTIESFHDVLSSWAGLVTSRGTPLDEIMELNGWLVATAKAGHLQAFCHQLLGPAFPAELKVYKASSAVDLKALKDYLKTDALKPKRALLPDDLVRVN